MGEKQKRKTLKAMNELKKYKTKYERLKPENMELHKKIEAMQQEIFKMKSEHEMKTAHNAELYNKWILASSKNEELQKLVHHLLDSQNNDKDKDLEDEKEGNQDVQDSPVENLGNHKEEQNDIKRPEISLNLSSNSSQKPLNDINNNKSKPLQNNDEEN